MYKIIIFLFFSNCVLSQSFSISGYVFDDNKKPVEYVCVSVPESKFGTYTDNTGYFQLNIPKNADSLVISMVGYQTIKSAVKEIRSNQSFYLKPVIYQLGQVEI